MRHGAQKKAAETAASEPALSPPESAEAVVATLTEGFEDFSAQLQRAARYVIDHPREVGVLSMRALAAKAEVHPNTLMRLAQAIGFEGFEAMRERFRDFLVADSLGGFRNRADWLQRLSNRGGADAVLGEMAEATADNLDVMWRRRTGRELSETADRLLGAERVFVLGMGSAYSLAHQFWYVARMAFDHITPIPRHGSDPIDDLAWVGPKDAVVAVTFQPYRAETVRAARFAAARGAWVLGVTDSATSPLARAADAALTTPTSTPHFFQSHAAATALLEGVIAVMVARAGDGALERIDAFHRQRLEAGLYEEPAPLAGIGATGALREGRE